jgi:hypothetical protein
MQNFPFIFRSLSRQHKIFRCLRNLQYKNTPPKTKTTKKWKQEIKTIQGSEDKETNKLCHVQSDKKISLTRDYENQQIHNKRKSSKGQVTKRDGYEKERVFQKRPNLCVLFLSESIEIIHTETRDKEIFKDKIQENYSEVSKLNDLLTFQCNEWKKLALRS